MVSWITDSTGKSIPLFTLEDLRDHISDEVYQAITELIDPDVIKDLEADIKSLEMDLDSYSEDIRVYRDCINEGVEIVDRLLDELSDRSKKINRGNIISGLRELRERLYKEL